MPKFEITFLYGSPEGPDHHDPTYMTAQAIMQKRSSSRIVEAVDRQDAINKFRGSATADEEFLRVEEVKEPAQSKPVEQTADAEFGGGGLA
ncbi:MAG: hypothetical protein NTY04_03135 [Candidatus Staskawiczbacteria bacterium]|nr:hypothetical protein [Candidatus Staskawiczbacteria bacterium]